MVQFTVNKTENELLNSLLREEVVSPTDLQNSFPEMSESFKWLVEDQLKEKFPPRLEKDEREVADQQLKKMTEKSIKALVELSYKSAPELCAELEKWFVKNNLYVKTSVVKVKKA